MNYFILAIDALSTAFSIMESGEKVKFKYIYGIKQDFFKDIVIGDLVFGYNKGFKSIKYLFKVNEVIDEGLILEKIIDICKGYSIENYEIINDLESNGFFKLDYENFRIFYENLLKSIPLFIDNKNSEIRNKIFFGAPGTGKSFMLNSNKDNLLDSTHGEYERVTFHPDYSYAHFVGTYKPVPKFKDGKETISYEYVPGPFMRVLVKALKNRSEPYLLIIEEINRANVAAVFGDVFQLLDRDIIGVSEYPINISEDMKNYLNSPKGLGKENYNKLIFNDELIIPQNMFIWATMNSADQGVFMMDTAFKRRWNFVYVDIDSASDEVKNAKISLGEGSNKNKIRWNSLRRAINKELLDYGVNEDKLLGPYFISPNFLPKEGDDETNKEFIEIFKNKVIMYLFEDVLKTKNNGVFSGVERNSKHLLYSEICNQFKTKGIYIFSESIQNYIFEFENQFNNIK